MLPLKSKPLAIATCLILSIFVATSTAQTATRQPCDCTTGLVRRSFLTSGACGKCGQCWWNLYYYLKKFPAKVPGLPSAQAVYTTKVQPCVKKIPSVAAIKPNKVCENDLKECLEKTDELFILECANLYPALKKPPSDAAEQAAYLANYKKRIHEEFKAPPKFDGKNEYFYPRTCPSHHRKYEFTYYMLFEAASKKPGYATEPYTTHWTEELAWPNVAFTLADPAIQSFRTLQFGLEEVTDFFRSHGLDDNILDGHVVDRRFCGHSDIFVCAYQTDLIT